MRWIGLNEGYVSGDGRFLVAQVTVKGKRGDVKKWALYGLVNLRHDDPGSSPWGWTERPIHGPVDTKRACQDWAASSGYEPPEVAADPQAQEQAPAPAKRVAWEVCQECGVDYPRHENHPYEDYCGPNCFEIVVERVEEVRENLRERASRPLTPAREEASP